MRAISWTTYVIASFLAALTALACWANSRMYGTVENWVIVHISGGYMQPLAWLGVLLWPIAAVVALSLVGAFALLHGRSKA